MTRPAEAPTREELNEILSSVEEHLHANEVAILIIASPKKGGGTTVSPSMNCDDATVQAALTYILRGYDGKVELAEGGTH